VGARAWPAARAELAAGTVPTFGVGYVLAHQLERRGSGAVSLKNSRQTLRPQGAACGFRRELERERFGRVGRSHAKA